MKKFLFLVLLAFMVGRADGQSSVQISPDCVATFASLVASTPVALPSGNGYDNSATRCAYWRITWTVYGAGAAVSGTLQDAPLNNAGTAPGTFVTFAGSTSSGSNPSTDLNNTATFIGFYPYIRINFTALTGSVKGTIYGWKEPSALGGSGGGAATHVIVDSGNVAVTGSVTTSGTVAVTNQQLCNTTDATTVLGFTFSALNGSQELVALSGTTRIYVCSIAAAWDNAINFKIIAGTGTACATGSTNLTGPLTNTVNTALTQQFRTAAGAALCINTSASASGGGQLVYIQQ